MTRIFVIGLVAFLLTATGAGAGQLAGGNRQVVPAVAVAQANSRPLHAVLRYDTSTTAACRSLSDASSELCLLLALHVIRMSEKPLPGGAM